jgi:hypothetical protein
MCRPLDRRAQLNRTQLGRPYGARCNEGELSYCDLMAVYLARNSRPHLLMRVDGEAQLDVAAVRLGKDGWRIRMHRDLLDGCGTANDVVRRDQSESLHGHNFRSRRSHCSRFVEQQYASSGKGLQRSSALDDDPVLRGARNTSDDGCRGREDQGTGSGDDQYSQRSLRGCVKEARLLNPARRRR